MRVIGETASSIADLESAAGHAEIIVVDLDSCPAPVLDFAADILESAGRARVLILTDTRDSEICRRAISLGAMGVVHKTAPVEVLFRAIEKVHAGELWLDRALMAGILREVSAVNEHKGDVDGAAARIAKLTKRERQVVAFLGKGMKTSEIADQVSVSETTVRHHLASIFNKLGVKDRFELVFYAYQQGLAVPPE
jgi:DNA-binding NarL/FixJ family response regulator